MTGPRPLPRPAWRRLALGVLAASAAGLAVSFARWPARAFVSLLVDGFWLLSLGLSALLFLATQRLSGARWSAGLRRIPEALAAVLPAGAALVLLVWPGRTALYPWSRPGAFAGAAAGAGKATYLAPGFVAVRMAVAALAWCAFAWAFRRASLDQDREPRRRAVHERRLVRVAAAFVPAFALTFTTGVYDWLVSVDPRWFSTLFAPYVFAGTFVQGMAAVTLLALVLRTRGPLRGEVGRPQLHDLGKLMFAFSTFWAYLWLCQYLLIWYGDIPDEVTHYLLRTRPPWSPLFFASFALNWAAPFVLLLSARAKTSPRVLAAAALLLLAGRWLDLELLVAPAVLPGPALGLPELSMAGACAALGALAVSRALSRAPLVPVNDPWLAARPEAAGEHA